MFNALGEDGITKFRNVFRENTARQVEAFFGSVLIKRLWPLIKENLTMENCFENKNKDISGSAYEAKINPRFRLSYAKVVI